MDSGSVLAEGYDKAEYERPAPNAFIQWKGTDVCGDYHCTCGTDWHIDGDFVYFVRCPACKQGYQVGCKVTLYPLTPVQCALVEADERFTPPTGED